MRFVNLDQRKIGSFLIVFQNEIGQNKNFCAVVFILLLRVPRSYNLKLDVFNKINKLVNIGPIPKDSRNTLIGEEVGNKYIEKRNVFPEIHELEKS